MLDFKALDKKGVVMCCCLMGQDVLAIRKAGKSTITFQLVHPTKRQLEDLEMDFDFSDAKVRDGVYKVR